MKSKLPLLSALCGILAAPTLLLSQEQAQDPFASPAVQADALAIPAERGGQVRAALRLRLETWEAPALEVARRLDDLRGAAALAKLRGECLAGAPGVTLIHSPVLTMDAATRMLGEAITERIYPTEYEPPSVPCEPMPTQEQKAAMPLADWMNAALTKTVPTSFETRNTGITLEALAQAVTVEEKRWDVTISFNAVDLAGMEKFGDESILVTMPAFTSFRTGGLVRLKEGEWRLLSVMEPPRGLEEEPSDKRWVTLVRIDPE